MTPDFRLIADAADITDALRTQLLQLRLTDKRGLEADELEITLNAPATLALPPKGARLEVALGWRGRGLVDKGVFVSDPPRFRGPPDEIIITAKAADFGSPLRENRSAAYHGQTLGGILGAVAERHGLSSVIEGGLAATAIDHLDQTNESDVNLIRRLGDQYDAIATIKEERLLFVPAGKGITASGAPLPVAVIDRSDTDRYEFGPASGDSDVTGVKAKWRALGPGKTKEELAGKDGNTRTLKRTYPTQAEARAAAEAAWAKTQRGQYELSLSLVHGRPDLIAGQPVTVTGWRSEITGRDWVAKDITHTLTNSRFTTEVPCEEMV